MAVANQLDIRSSNTPINSASDAKFSRKALPTSRVRGDVQTPSLKSISPKTGPRIELATGFYKLPSGAELAYNLYGAKDGFPLVFFHDTGSSRLEAKFIDESAKNQGFQIIAIDRPGIGLSDFYRLSSPKQLCGEVLALLADLNIDEFGIIGLGAGGLYGLNLAYLQPSRVKFQVCLAGVSAVVFNENSKPSLAANLWSRALPPFLQTFFKIKEFLFPFNHEQALCRLYERVSYMDKKALQNPTVMAQIRQDQHEAVRFGSAGLVQDIGHCFTRLSFKLNSISVPTSIWQGDADRITQRADCEFMASRIPSAKLYRVSKSGYFFYLDNMDAVLGKARADYLQSS